MLLTTPKTPEESGGTVGSGGSGLPEVDLDIKGQYPAQTLTIQSKPVTRLLGL